MSDTIAITSAQDDAADRRRRIIAIVGSSSGNLVEWYDFYCYAFFALYFAPAFFPQGELDKPAFADRRRFCCRLLYAANWRLAVWSHRRSCRSPRLNDHLGCDDVRRIALHRPHSDL